MWVQRRGASGLKQTSCRLLWACFPIPLCPSGRILDKTCIQYKLLWGGGGGWGCERKKCLPLSTANYSSFHFAQETPSVWNGQRGSFRYSITLPVANLHISLMLTEQLECDLSNPLGGDGWNSWQKWSNQTLIFSFTKSSPITCHNKWP